MAKIREIFVSIQGEGPYVGTRQLFIRFCGCNLHCNYCDTDFEISKSKEYSPSELMNEISKMNDIFTVSLTGGEPLFPLNFLKHFCRFSRLRGTAFILKLTEHYLIILQKLLNTLM